jgi:hypothetical protein
LWPNIRFLPSIVAEKNAMKNEHICSMCIKINKVSKQEVGIRWVQKRFPRYGVPIISYWHYFTTKIMSICPIWNFTLYVTQSLHFFENHPTIDDRDLIFGHKRHIGTRK